MITSTGERTTYRMRIRTLTPVFVGGGNGASLNRTEYIYDADRQQVFILDEPKFLEMLSARKWLDSYCHYVATNGGDNQSSAGNRRNGREMTRSRQTNANNIHLADWLRERKITDYRKISRYSLAAVDVDKSTLNDIHCFVRDGLGRPYVPGSSIKGALRAILLKNILATEDTRGLWNQIEATVMQSEERGNRTQQGNRRDQEGRDDRKQGDQAKQLKRLGKGLDVEKTHLVTFPPDIESDARHRPKKDSPLRDVFRGISISDSEPIDPERLYITRRISLTTYKGRANQHVKRLSLYAEYLKPGTELTFTLTLDQKYLQNTPWPTWEDILSSIQRFGQRLPELMGDPVFGSLGDYNWSFDPYAIPNFCLGGQTGWPAKTILPELAPDSKSYIRLTKTLLDRSFHFHKHGTLDREISPRTLKLASYDGRLYVVGMCQLDVLAP